MEALCAMLLFTSILVAATIYVVTTTISVRFKASKRELWRNFVILIFVWLTLLVFRDILWGILLKYPF
jgi:hypothetical protein